MSSEISLAQPCWAPPVFPDEGRLILSEAQVNANYQKQMKEAEDFKNRLSAQAGTRLGFVCSQSLHISLFFIRLLKMENKREALLLAHQHIMSPNLGIGMVICQMKLIAIFQGINIINLASILQVHIAGKMKTVEMSMRKNIEGEDLNIEGEDLKC